MGGVDFTIIGFCSLRIDVNDCDDDNDATVSAADDNDEEVVVEVEG